MIAALPAKPATPNRIDAIGGIHCWRLTCDKPLMKASYDRANPPEIVIFRKCDHCGSYNIIDVARLADTL